jgi:hypothetical protein
MTEGDLFQCARLPNTRITPMGCARRYREAHSPYAFGFRDVPGVKVPPNPTMGDFIRPSFWYCFYCPVGQQHAADQPNNQPKPKPKPKPRPRPQAATIERRTPECLMPGCTLRAQCRGMCNGHYSAWHAGRLDAVLGPWFRGPGNPKIKQEEKAVEVEKERLEVVCRRCGKKAAGTVEEVAKVFQPNKLSSIGFDGICRECKTNKMAATWRAGKERREKDPYRIELDFNDDIDVFLAVQELARQGRRDVPNQIMWILEQAAQVRRGE